MERGVGGYELQLPCSAQCVLFLNARSICNKSRLINDFIADHNIDLFALSETWLRGDDSDL